MDEMFSMLVLLLPKVGRNEGNYLESSKYRKVCALPPVSVLAILIFHFGDSSAPSTSPL